jgi:hypothetical protein
LLFCSYGIMLLMPSENNKQELKFSTIAKHSSFFTQNCR